MGGVSCQLLRERQMLVQRCSLSTLASKRKEQGRASRTRGPCSRTPLLVFGVRGSTLEDCWKLDGKLNTRYIACTSNCMYVKLNVSHIEYTSH